MANPKGLAQINLGWMYLPIFTMGTVTAFTDWASKQTRWPELKPVLDRLVIVSDASFSTIVDDQLEVRTSVSISPQTGAAEPGALFTAEALPRASVLQFHVTALNSENFRLPNGAEGGGRVGKTIDEIHRIVWSGLELLEFLGIGGMNTRGMGRLKVFPAPEGQNV